MHDRRCMLSQAIQNLSSPQRVYMPGAFTLLNEVDPTVISDTPEKAKIWFPSHLQSSSRDGSCVAGLPLLEFRFHLAQAYDALDLIRHLRGVYQALLVKNQVHVTASQGTMAKARALFTNFTLKIEQAAACYRDARTALLHLDPDKGFSRWKKDIQELCWEDIHGPSREDNESSESHQQPSWISLGARRYIISGYIVI